MNMLKFVTPLLRLLRALARAAPVSCPAAATTEPTSGAAGAGGAAGAAGAAGGGTAAPAPPTLIPGTKTLGSKPMRAATGVMARHWSTAGVGHSASVCLPSLTPPRGRE